MDYLKNKNGKLIRIADEMESLKASVASEYKSLRQEKKMTQQKFADAAGMNRVDVSRFESGNYNPSLELLVRCASVLNCDIKFELVPRTDE